MRFSAKCKKSTRPMYVCAITYNVLYAYAGQCSWISHNFAKLPKSDHWSIAIIFTLHVFTTLGRNCSQLSRRRERMWQETHWIEMERDIGLRGISTHACNKGGMVQCPSFLFLLFLFFSLLFFIRFLFGHYRPLLYILYHNWTTNNYH